MFLLLPDTKSIAGTLRGAAARGQSVYTASSAVVSEIIAPAGSDMQMLPPTVASCATLNDISRE